MILNFYLILYLYPRARNLPVNFIHATLIQPLLISTLFASVSQFTFLAFDRFDLISTLCFSLFPLLFVKVSVHSNTQICLHFDLLLVKSNKRLAHCISEYANCEIQGYRDSSFGGNRETRVPDAVVSKIRRCTDVQFDNVHIFI